MNLTKFYHILEEQKFCVFNVALEVPVAEIGFVVGGYGEHITVSTRKFEDKMIKFVADNPQLLSDGLMCLDGFHPSDDESQVTLRVVRVFMDLDEALQAGFDNAQESIFSFKAHKHIRVPNAGVIRIAVFQDAGLTRTVSSNTPNVVFTELTVDAGDTPITYPDEGTGVVDVKRVDVDFDPTIFDLNNNFE